MARMLGAYAKPCRRSSGAERAERAISAMSWFRESYFQTSLYSHQSKTGSPPFPKFDFQVHQTFYDTYLQLLRRPIVSSHQIGPSGVL